MAITERLILFTRYPESGVTKTRLIPALGPEGAAALQRQMTVHVLAQASALTPMRPVAIEVHFEGGTAAQMRAWLGDHYQYRRQGQGNIGARMHQALAAAFSDGARRAVLIGSDIPDITIDLLAAAFDHLHSTDVVLGPASDGGYYLIGVRHAAWAIASKGLFKAVPWGTAHVLAVSCQRIKAFGIEAVLLPTLSDIDRPEDLVIWKPSRR